MRFTSNETTPGGGQQGLSEEIMSALSRLADEALRNYGASNGSFEGAARLIVIVVGPGMDGEASCGSVSEDIHF